MAAVRAERRELPRLRTRMAWWPGRRNRATAGPGDRCAAVCGSRSTGGYDRGLAGSGHIAG
jgi:hypothetical protein